MTRKSLLLAFLLAVVPPAHAGEFSISADTLEQEEGTFRAQGSVRMERGEAVLEADEVWYDEPSGEASASGGVRYEDLKVEILADWAVLNLYTQTGVLSNAAILVKEDNYHIQGAEVRRTAEDRYFLTEASLTTCDAPLPAWCIRGRDVDIVLGDRVKARHASFRVKGLPVFYTPYLWAPLLTERKTGFLMPTLGYRKDKGAFFRLPFFLVLSENRDITFYLDGFTERGLGGGLEYRYIERPGIEGLLYTYYIRDQRLDRDFLEVRVRHEQWGRWLSARADINQVNRREFFRIYEPYLDPSTRRFLESRAEVFASFGNSRLSLLGQFNTDLKAGVEQSAVPQRLPEAGFFLAPLRLGPVVLQGTASAANFVREEGTEGQRYDVTLKLSHSIGRRFILSQSIFGRETVYNLQDGDFDRGVAEYRAEVKTRFIRHGRAIRHTLEPSVSYRYVIVGEDEPPLFDILELSEETSVVELALLSRMMDARGEFLTLRAVQPLNDREEESTLLPMRFDLSLTRPLRVQTSIVYDVDLDRLESAHSSLRQEVGPVSLSLGQSYRADADVFRTSFGVEVRASRDLTLRGGLKYDFEGGGVREVTSGLNYRSQCWGVDLTYVENPEEFNLFLRIILKGLGAIGA